MMWYKMNKIAKKIRKIAIGLLTEYKGNLVKEVEYDENSEYNPDKVRQNIQNNENNADDVKVINHGQM